MRSLFLLLMLSGSVQAQTQLAPLNFYQACFGGLDNYHDSARIDNCDFQDMVNVLTDRGFLEKRPGSVRIFDSVLSDKPIRNIKEYITNTNRKYMLIHASQTIYSTDLLTTVAIATTNVNAVMDSVSGFDKHFIVDGYDVAIYYDGTSTYTVENMPICKYIEFANERILCGNVTGAASTVFTSAFGDYTTWTIPILESADAPTAWSFDQQDGKPLTGMFQSPFGLLAFKRTKTFIIRGVDNDDYEKRRISDNIGCVDDRSIQLVNGCPQWLGVEGVYKWCGGSGAPELISREVDTTIKAIRNITSNADVVTLTTKADFDNGFFSTNGSNNGFSTSIVPNSIIPSSWTTLYTTGADFARGTLSTTATTYLDDTLALFGETFSDGNCTNDPVWTTAAGGWGCDGNANSETLSSILFTTSTKVTGTWEFDIKRSWNENGGVYFISTTKTGSGFWVELNWSTGDTVLFRDGPTAICTISGTYVKALWGHYKVTRTINGLFTLETPLGTCSGTYVSSPTSQYMLLFRNAGLATIYFDNIQGSAFSNGVYTSDIIETPFATPIGGPFTVTYSTPPGTSIFFEVRASTSPNNDLWTAWTTNSSTVTGQIPYKYIQYTATLQAAVGETPLIYDLTVHVTSTGTWDSEVLAVGSLITSWGQFSAITDTNDKLLFYTRASTNTYTKDSSTPTWTLQGNGYNIACDTGTFLQARVVSTVGSSTDTAQVNSITLNWYEGDAAQVASLFWDGRYYISVSTGSNATTNNTVLVQQRTGKWTLFNNVSWSTLGIYDNYPYAGDGLTTSKIWRIIEEENYFDDNTVPINAYAVTKDFQFDGQNNSKILRRLYLESSASVANTMSLGYSVDKSTSYTTTTQAIGTNTYNDEVKQMFPGFAKGRYLRLKFSNNNIYEPLMLNGYTLIGDIEQLYRK